MNNIEHAYNALRIAADRMGENNYRAGQRAHVKAGRRPTTYRYTPTPEHAAVVAAMPKLLAGELTPNDTMAMLHQYDTLHQRLGSARQS